MISPGSLLFNIYTYDPSATVGAKNAYADDLAIMCSAEEWKTVEETLNQDMTILARTSNPGDSSSARQKRCRQLSISVIGKQLQNVSST